MRGFMRKPVTIAELNAIAQAARWTGTSRNEQPLRFIVIRDRATIEKVAEAGLPQTRGLPTAPAAIAIVEPDEPERGLSRAFDDGRAAERILIAANLLGFAGGISRVRTGLRPVIDGLLGVPAGRSVRTIVAIGHPSKEATARKSKPGQARLPTADVIFQGRWPPPPVEED
jgi:nitroreductase